MNETTLIFTCALCGHGDRDLGEFIRHWQQGHDVEAMREAVRQKGR